MLKNVSFSCLISVIVSSNSMGTPAPPGVNSQFVYFQNYKFDLYEVNFVWKIVLLSIPKKTSSQIYQYQVLHLAIQCSVLFQKFCISEVTAKKIHNWRFFIYNPVFQIKNVEVQLIDFVTDPQGSDNFLSALWTNQMHRSSASLVVVSN